MNDAEQRRFLDTLRRDDDFRAAVRRELLTEELLNLPQTVATLVDVVAQQRQDFTALAADVRTYMERTISLVGEGFTAVRGEISDLRTGTETGFAAVRGEISDLRTGTEAGFAAVRGEISDLRTGTDAGFTAVDAKLDQANAEIREIKDQLAS